MSSAEQARWFSEHVQPQEPALRAYLSKRFPTLPDHDDLVQETYVRVLRVADPARLVHPKAFLLAAALEAETVRATPVQLDFLARLNDSHRLGLAKLGTRVVAAPTEKAPTIDLAKIASQKGAIATTALEGIILAVEKLKPNHARGETLFTQQGCVACHALQPGGAILGPFMGQIGSIMNPAQIATAILRPSDTISQGFQTVMLTMKDGSVRTGFTTETTSDKIVLRDMTGAVSTVLTADVKEDKHLPTSMMPEGLTNALSLEEFAALVHFLASKK